MFARNVVMHLRPNSVKQFTEKLESQVIPILREQEGFQDVISFVLPNGKEAVGISFWENEKDAEAYSRTTYKKVITALADVIEGTPEVKTYEVTTSTVHSLTRRR